MPGFAPGFETGGGGSVLPVGTRKPIQQRYRQWANEFGMEDTTALLNVLIGAVAGTTATKGHTRVKHNSGSAVDNGGKMQVEAPNTINRASTAQDVTDLKALFANVRRAPSPYPRDLSGNGGPAFTPG
ncbi:MAG TPA: hypothetical protein VLG09_04105 [Candidatus Saccharimonadales bacterium]|nr:hypothetical protein [Candidatus Saccharimonadales bacterium]